MTEVPDETLQPMAPLERHDPGQGGSSGDFFSKLVFILSVLLMITALAASAYAFAGFAENDTGFVHLLSAFALCFGIGGLIFAPMGLVAVYAKRAIRTPLSQLRSFIVLLLVLPWIPFCYYLLGLGELPKLVAIAGIMSAIIIGLWAARFLRRS